MYAFRVHVDFVLPIMLLVVLVLSRSGINYDSFLMSISMACVMWAYGIKYHKAEKKIGVMIAFFGGFALLFLSHYF